MSKNIDNKECKSILMLAILLLSLLSVLFVSMPISKADAVPPSVTINFAGNLSESGGPYWRPPTEDDRLDHFSEGIWRDGYYTNASKQHEDWIHICCTITDPDGVAKVWLNWLNETTWTNWTYYLNNTSGDYYNITTNLWNIKTYEGYNYSFDIVANDTCDNSIITQWNKTGITGGYHRRFVQLNCSPVNISYTPFFFYKATYTNDDKNTEDRLYHDQGPNGTLTDTGFLKLNNPEENVEEIHCLLHIGAWFEESICIEPLTLDNIYYHIWWSSPHDALDEVGWHRQRDHLTSTCTEYHSTDATENRSTIIYDHGLESSWSKQYFLHTKLAATTTGNRNFTDNDIYELAIKASRLWGYPSAISNRSFPSFVLFNVPDNATLKNGANDTDGLNDWEELFITYTNPFLDDTDNDGVDDYGENCSGSDPNNWTDRYFMNFSTPEPADDATDISRYIACNITVADPFGKHMNLTFSSRPAGGSFSSFGSIKYGSTSRFGFDKTSNMYDSVDEVIRGTWFTCPANGTAESIKAYCDFGSPGGGIYHYAKAAVYYKGNNTLLANTSENAYYGTPPEPSEYWTTFTFPDPPTLNAGEEYYVLVWGNGTGPLYNTSFTGLNRSISISKTYEESWPSDLDNENINHVLNKTYDLYVVYTTSATSNGTYYMDNFDISETGTSYYWKVSAYNGLWTDMSKIYNFTTVT